MLLDADTDAKAGADDNVGVTTYNQYDGSNITTYLELSLVTATATSVTGS